MDSKKDKDGPKPVVARTTYDLQRIKLEKLMKNPDKVIPIPERPKDRSMPQAPDFVRNVMGSSAGAGSGEFHVYRHLRRKEYARQKYIKEKGRKELLEDEYHNKLEQNRLAAEEKTAKKRAKRLKRKQKQKGAKKSKPQQKSSSSSSESDEESAEEGARDSQAEPKSDTMTAEGENAAKTEDSKIPEKECADTSTGEIQADSKSSETEQKEDPKPVISEEAKQTEKADSPS